VRVGEGEGREGATARWGRAAAAEPAAAPSPAWLQAAEAAEAYRRRPPRPRGYPATSQPPCPPRACPAASRGQPEELEEVVYQVFPVFQVSLR
jgi:hypothetical protein